MTAWRNAASLIAVARHGQKYKNPLSSAACDYNLLCLKRHEESSFMPGTYVFPGGNVDPADSDLKWHKLFAAFGFDNRHFVSLVPKAAVRPQILKSQRNELSRDISLRITAIRETFEECGVLMCRRRDDRALSVWAQHLSVSQEELQTWRRRIRNNAAEFLTLCEKFECYPDLWALHEWNNWLSPAYLPRRYDTAFYLACLQFAPSTAHDAIEIENVKWETPENLWSLVDVILPPPQQYEVSNLAKLKRIDHVLECAVQRGKVGVQMYLPVLVNLKDGNVHVLPGDTMYPKKIDPTEKLIIDRSDVTMDEFREMTQVKHRMESVDVRMTIFHADDAQITDRHVSLEPGDPQMKHKY